jgi:hypothetical protein
MAATIAQLTHNSNVALMLLSKAIKSLRRRWGLNAADNHIHSNTHNKNNIITHTHNSNVALMLLSKVNERRRRRQQRRRRI